MAESKKKKTVTNAELAKRVEALEEKLQAVIAKNRLR